MTSKAEVLLPENIEHGSIEHYRYLFYSCMLNYGMKSSILHENLMKLYEQKPLIFSPKYICKTYENNFDALADILRSYVHVRYPNQCAKNWFFYLRFYTNITTIIRRNYLLEKIRIMTFNRLF